ncbi:MAG TPA: hypothetical protein VI461_08300 [Chitinophagaceae bacterium]|nr:hypothetical protein [Chitinophagaceae bacterium]
MPTRNYELFDKEDVLVIGFILIVITFFIAYLFDSMELLISILTLIVLTVTAYFIRETLASQKHEANFRIIYQEMTELKNSIERYEYDGAKGGEDAIQKFVSYIGVAVQEGIIKQKFCDDIEKFDDLFLGAFQRIFFFRDTLKTSNEYKDIINRDLKTHYRLNFQYALRMMKDHWNPSTDIVSNDLISQSLKGKMEQLKQNFIMIEEKISPPPLGKILVQKYSI